MSNLTYNSYIKAGDNYFKPVGMGIWKWMDEDDGNRRREQVVTLQDSVIDLFNCMPSDFKSCFNGERVWIASRNVAIRDLEDRLLKYAQRESLRPFLHIHQGPSDEIWRDLRQRRAQQPGNGMLTRCLSLSRLPIHPFPYLRTCDSGRRVALDVLQENCPQV